MLGTIFTWMWLVALYLFKAFCWIFVASSAVWFGLGILFAAYRVTSRYVVPRVTMQD